MKAINAPITYFGGKGTMIKNILAEFPEEGTYQTFVDAYGGSGVVLFKKPYVPNEVYNDIDQNVASLYRVLSDPKKFELFKLRAELSVFHEGFSSQYQQDLRGELSEEDRAYKFWYVNRTRRGGGLGGLKVNTVVRRNMSKSTSDFLSAVDRLDELHQRISSVIFLQRDALELIPQWDRDDTLIYCDPPYHHDTRTSARYNEDVDGDHHKQLVGVLLSMRKSRIVVSGYDHETYNPLVEAGWTKVQFPVKTVTGKNAQKTKIETLWKNY